VSRIFRSANQIHVLHWIFVCELGMPTLIHSQTTPIFPANSHKLRPSTSIPASGSRHHRRRRLLPEFLTSFAKRQVPSSAQMPKKAVTQQPRTVDQSRTDAIVGHGSWRDGMPAAHTFPPMNRVDRRTIWRGSLPEPNQKVMRY